IPDNGSFQLILQFLVNGRDAAPAPPEFGFTSAALMYAWVLANWGFYGTWYLLADRLVLYMKPGIARTASLSITVQAIYRYAATIPLIGVDQTYGLVVSFPPAEVETSSTSGVISGLLDYAIANYGEYGTWLIESF